MPVFACSNCDVVENTALSNAWFHLRDNSPLLCSECDPMIGKWHGKFPRQTREEAGYTSAVDARGFLTTYVKRTT